MKLDVMHNAKRNIIWGLLNKIIVMLCPFITRTVTQYILGAQYLGLDSLFTSIISVLSLSELGFSSAVIFHLYKPVAEGDTKKVNAILRFYRKVYRIIGLCILVGGVLLAPFLPHLVKGTYPGDIVLWKLYIIYLVNAVVSYFMFSYLTAIITVYQREDINSTRNSVITILLTVSRVIVLVAFRNYYLYAVMLPIFTILTNVWIARVVKTNFPQYRCEGELPSGFINEIKKIVAGAFIQKACAVTRNSLDSICISMFLGLTMTAIYNNYFYIMSSITALIGIITVSFAGGVGNHVAIKSSEENFEEMQKMDFIYLWLSGWCSICLLCLYQPFMLIWMGKDMLLDYPSMILLCIYFYLLKLGDVRSLYNAANGLWWEQRWRSIIETLMNFLLNIMLGKLFGVIGIIAATCISLFLCNCLWATRIIFTKYFDLDKLKIHFRTQSLYTVTTVGIAAITFGCCSVISINSQIADLIIRAMVCMILPNVLYFIVYHRTLVFKQSINLIRRKHG